MSPHDFTIYCFMVALTMKVCDNLYMTDYLSLHSYCITSHYSTKMGQTKYIQVVHKQTRSKISDMSLGTEKLGNIRTDIS